MTSLIDIIFLLLLFFMLTSTFTKFSEIELSSASSGGMTPPDVPPVFLQLAEDTITLNGTTLKLGGLATSTLQDAKPGTPLLISLKADVNAQRLTDLLVALRGLPRLTVTVLGS